MRSYSSSKSSSKSGSGLAPCETLVIAFGGLQQRFGGGHGGGVAPYEFVKSCQRAGATHALFVRDPTRSWYCRGVGGAKADDEEDAAVTPAMEGSESFDGMIAALRKEVKRLQPTRVVTIGSSMGGYAAVRAGLALSVDIAVAFSPQVLISPEMRRGASLDPMHFDELLSWLRVVGEVEGFELTPLTDAARRAPVGCTTRLEVHAGSSEAGDVHEAELLVAAVEEEARKRSSSSSGSKRGDGGGASVPTATLTVHPNRDHNLVIDLRDNGELHTMLQSWLQPSAATSAGMRATSSLDKLQARCEASPHDSTLAFDLAQALLDASQPSNALVAIDKAITLKPINGEAWVVRANILNALKRYIDAAFTLQETLSCWARSSARRPIVRMTR